MRTAEALLRWGRLLTWAIVFVSALHIWETVAAIAPSDAGTLHLPAWLYHSAALGFTLMIDACALYIVKANATAAYTSAPPIRWTLFFYVVTALLNASFVATYAPAISPTLQAQLLPLLSTAFVFLLPLSVPIGIIAVEAASRTLEAARLTLLVEVTTLRELLAATAQHEPSEPGSGSCFSAPESGMEASPNLPAQGHSGGKLRQFTLADVCATLEAATHPLSPQELRQHLRCGETTIHRLLHEGRRTGRIVRNERGAYRLSPADQ